MPGLRWFVSAGGTSAWIAAGLETEVIRGLCEHNVGGGYEDVIIRIVSGIDNCGL